MHAKPPGHDAPAAYGLSYLRPDCGRFFRSQSKVRRPFHQHVPALNRPGILRQPCLALAAIPWHRIEVECWRQTPAMVTRVIQEPGIPQMVIGIADQKIEDQPAPQLMYVSNRVRTFPQQDINQFRIGVHGVPAIRLQHRRGRYIGNTAAIVGTIEPPDDGNRRPADQLHTRRCHLDACFGSKMHGQHFASDDIAPVSLAGKLAQCQAAIRIPHARLGPSSAQRSALPEQILQVARGLRSSLQRSSRLHDLIQLHQRRHMSGRCA
ncbi:hypothetical protein AZ15_0552 [Bordetella bronchiseptica A1-7]|nr:hypothetical protein AZ15_0552 [Bordetella bronchiseptica A1-7]